MHLSLTVIGLRRSKNWHPMEQVPTRAFLEARDQRCSTGLCHQESHWEAREDRGAPRCQEWSCYKCWWTLHRVWSKSTIGILVPNHLSTRRGMMFYPQYLGLWVQDRPFGSICARIQICASILTDCFVTRISHVIYFICFIQVRRVAAFHSVIGCNDAHLTS